MGGWRSPATGGITKLSRSPFHMTPRELEAARQLLDARRHMIAEIAATLGVSRVSIYRSLNDTAAGRW